MYVCKNFLGEVSQARKVNCQTCQRWFLNSSWGWCIHTLGFGSVNYLYLFIRSFIRICHVCPVNKMAEHVGWCLHVDLKREKKYQLWLDSYFAQKSNSIVCERSSCQGQNCSPRAPLISLLQLKSLCLDPLCQTWGLSSVMNKSAILTHVWSTKLRFDLCPGEI